MSNLKNLVAKANSGLSLRSTPKERFGLNGFLAASTDQMLMTRGGYGSQEPIYGSPDNWWGGSAGGPGPGGVLGSSFTVGSPNDYHIITNSTGNTSTSRIPGYYNIAVKKTSEWLTVDNIIGLGGRLLGFLFTTSDAGKGSALTDNPNYKGSVLK